MISKQNNSNSLIIILHEIYGINQHMQLICEHYRIKEYDVLCPNLLNENMVFNYNETEYAYQYYMGKINFESSFLKVRKTILKLRDQYQYIILVGYSIGASIAWLLSNENDLIDGVVGFYGSRIRDFLELTPKCPVILFFPKHENQ